MSWPDLLSAHELSASRLRIADLPRATARSAAIAAPDLRGIEDLNQADDRPDPQVGVGINTGEAGGCGTRLAAWWGEGFVARRCRLVH